MTRVISGVETRVSISGPLQEPELRLASTPPLDQSDILSLIVFNTSTNELSAAQQQELAVRAGTLAAGFLAAPILAAIENELGLDILEIEPGEFGTGPKVTIGDEIAPGLVARFSRQFGQDAYDEATIEYYLSRLFRIRATFSDAQSLTPGPRSAASSAPASTCCCFSASEQNRASVLGSESPTALSATGPHPASGQRDFANQTAYNCFQRQTSDPRAIGNVLCNSSSVEVLST